MENAKRLLGEIPEQLAQHIQSKQITRIILTNQADMVKNILDEGIGLGLGLV